MREKLWCFALAALLFAGCDDERMPQQLAAAPAAESRFTQGPNLMIQTGVASDNLNLTTVRDSSTGVEYIVVSGTHGVSTIPAK